MVASYDILTSIKPDKSDAEYNVLIDSIKDLMIQMLKMYGEPPKDFLKRLNSKSMANMMVNFCCTNLPVSSNEKQELLEISSDKERAYKLLIILNREIQMLEMKASIQMKTREELNQQQKEYFCNSNSEPSKTS